MSFIRTYLLLVLLLAIISLPLYGQQDTAIVVGVISDQTGAVLPNAAVTLTNVSTNTSAEVHTDERGEYRTPPLRIGDYDLQVELAGFKRFVQRNVSLSIGDVRSINATLETGQVTENVTVEAAIPLLQAADSTVGTVITNREIGDLPLNGRDYLQLAVLSSGTTATPGIGISIGGHAGTDAAFLLDGQDNNNQQIATTHSNQKEVIKPSVDAIQEFKVVTNGYSAEYGRSSSGVVTVSLKSGTNQFHGAAWEFLRNDADDARNFFASQKPAFRRNQFGADIGGPIIHDRTFFFADFEASVIRQSATTVATLPSAAQRSGQFTSAILDPLSGQPFAGNQIPAARFDSAALRILSHAILPQTGASANNFVFNSPQNQDPRSGDIRLDQNLGAAQNFFLRYSYQKRNNGVAESLPPDAQGNYYANGGAERNQNKSYIASYNRVWSPKIVTTIRAGFNGTYWDRFLPDQPLKGIDLPGIAWNYPNIPGINITGYQEVTGGTAASTTFGIGIFTPNHDESIDRQLTGDLTWTLGAHTLKLGAQTYWLQTNFSSPQNNGGLFAFNGQYTKDPFADFLLGYSSQATLSTPTNLHFRTTFVHFFAQDDWRVSRRLTFNLGLRYEYSPPYLDAHDVISNFDMDTDPAHPHFVLAGSQGSNHADRALQAVNKLQFAPRFGFAYSLPGDKTVIRGGYGIFYSNIITLAGNTSLEINPPNTVRIVENPSPTQPTVILSQGFAPNALSVANATNLNPISYDRRNRTPYAQQWNINIQRQLPGGFVVEVGYNGNHFLNNWRQVEGNAAPPGPGSINPRREFTTATIPGAPAPTTLSNVLRIQRDGFSRYNALQIKIEKRYAKGLYLLASYSYSRTVALEDGYQDPLNQAPEISVADTDRPHYFVASGLYDLPFGKGRTIGSQWGAVANTILGGWSFGPIIRANSGTPFNLSVAGNPSNNGVGKDRPNLMGNPGLANQSPNEWFNTSAFAKNAPYTYGNVPHNFLRGPSFFNVDAVLRKSFRLNERITADLRLESFNLLNHTNLDPPNATVGVSNFGTISSAEPSRSNQAGLKILF